jgi:hypothetical protein
MNAVTTNGVGFTASCHCLKDAGCAWALRVSVDDVRQEVPQALRRVTVTATERFAWGVPYIVS